MTLSCVKPTVKINRYTGFPSPLWKVWSSHWPAKSHGHYCDGDVLKCPPSSEGFSASPEIRDLQGIILYRKHHCCLFPAALMSLGEQMLVKEYVSSNWVHQLLPRDHKRVRDFNQSLPSTQNFRSGFPSKLSGPRGTKVNSGSKKKIKKSIMTIISLNYFKPRCIEKAQVNVGCHANKQNHPSPWPFPC